MHRPLVADLAKSVGEFSVLRPPYFHVAKEMRGGGDDVYFSSPPTSLHEFGLIKETRRSRTLEYVITLHVVISRSRLRL